MRQSVALAFVASVGALAAPQICPASTETLISTVFLTQTQTQTATVSASVYAAGSGAPDIGSNKAPITVTETSVLTSTKTETETSTAAAVTAADYSGAPAADSGSALTVTETSMITKTETETETASAPGITGAGYTGAPAAGSGSPPVTVTETKTETHEVTLTHTEAPTIYGSGSAPLTITETKTETHEVTLTKTEAPTGHGTVIVPSGPHHYPTGGDSTEGGAKPTGHHSSSSSLKGHHPTGHSTSPEASSHTKSGKPTHSANKAPPGHYGPGPVKYTQSEKPSHTPAGYKPSSHGTPEASETKTPGHYGPGPVKHTQSEKPSHTPAGYKPSSHRTPEASETKSTPLVYGPVIPTHLPAGYTPSHGTPEASETKTPGGYKPSGYNPAPKESSSSAYGAGPKESSSSVYGAGPKGYSSASLSTAGVTSSVYGAGPKQSSSSAYGAGPKQSDSSSSSAPASSSIASSSAAATKPTPSATTSGSGPSSSQITNATCFDTGAGNKDNAKTDDGLSTATSSYACYSGPASNFPTKDKWVSFDEMWTINSAIMGCWNKTLPQNLPSYPDMIKNAIQQVAEASLVDHRVVLAQIMQESGGCVNTPTTTSWSGVPNPGLMQTHNGTSFLDGGYQTKSSDKQQAEITQMIVDGVQGTIGMPGGGEGVLQALNRYGDVFSAVRYYNSGAINAENLSDGLKATAHYSSDIANRLQGWNGNGQKTCPNFVCGQGEANC